MFISLLFCFISIEFVFGGRVGDYNSYKFISGSTDKYPRCLVEGCKATSYPAMCNENIGSSTWDDTRICSADRRKQSFLQDSSKASNNLTWDILVSTKECNDTGFQYTSCAKEDDLRSNKITWFGAGVNGVENSCRNCPVCKCDHPSDADKWSKHWSYDRTNHLLQRSCMRCQCTNSTSTLLSTTTGIPTTLPTGTRGGWTCSSTKTSLDYQTIVGNNGSLHDAYYCGPDTLVPTINPTKNHPTQNPTVHSPTGFPTMAPTGGCFYGNATVNTTYNVGTYYFDNWSKDCTSFCKCNDAATPYCKKNYTVIANDEVLRDDFFKNCHESIGQCFSVNGTKALARAVPAVGDFCSSNVYGNAAYGTTNYWRLMCPRCPCSFSQKNRYSSTWNGSIVISRTLNGSSNINGSTQDSYKCIDSYTCTNTTNIGVTVDSSFWFMQISIPGNTPNNNYSDVACTSPAHKCMEYDSPLNTPQTNTKAYDQTDYQYDYCYWRNFTSDRTSKICLLGTPTTSYQPVNLYGQWGHSLNWFCEAYLNASGNSGGSACWNQKVSWKSEVFNCYTLEWETEEISTQIRYSCCSSNSYQACNNQTIREGSKNCGSNSLLGSYYKTLWERTYGNRGQWSTEAAALVYCNVQPGVNRSIADIFFNQPNANENACSYLKSFYMDQTQTFCDTRKVLYDSGQLTDINAEYMWKQFKDQPFYSTKRIWSDNHVQWYDYFNCSWNKYNVTGYNYPPANFYEPENSFAKMGCVDFGSNVANPRLQISIISIVMIAFLSMIWS